jgi:uncharacterized protein
MDGVQEEVWPGVWLDGELSLWFKEYGTLVIADIHWGYALSQRRQGALFPDWGNQQITERLHRLLERYQPQRMVWLGDALHTMAGREMAEQFLEGTTVETLILRGNHDRKWAKAISTPLVMGPYWLHHGDQLLVRPSEAIEIIGHFHPAITCRDGAGLRLKLPAFIQGSTRWILPAFSPWAAGTKWQLEGACEEKVWLIAPRRIFPYRFNP